jgi:hypothetical protein
MPGVTRSMYYWVMPKDPLIKDHGKRRLVIAIAMGVLLVVTLLAAKLISGAKLGL